MTPPAGGVGAVRTARKAAVLVAPFAFVAALWMLTSEPRVDGALTLENAEFLGSESAAPPPSSDGWVPRDLPDDWLRSRAGIRDGWYRLRFRVEEVDGENWAVYLSKLSMNAAVFLNGEPIGDGGRFDEPLARNSNRPLLFSIPPGLLTTVDNVLDVRIRSNRLDMGLLGPIRVGPAETLVPVYERSYAMRVTAVWIFVVLRIVMALFTAILWTQRKSDAYYGWFAFALLDFAIPDFMSVAQIPVPTTVWYWLWYVAIGWWAILSARSILSFIGDENPTFERGVLMLGLVGSVILAAVAAFQPDWIHLVGVQVWSNLTWLAALYAIYRVVAVGKLGGIEAEALYVIGVSALLSALHDLLADTGWRARDLVTFPPYASPLLVFGVGWILVRRFVGAVSESEALVETLEERVRQRRAELEQSYARIQAMEHDRIVAEERDRIQRDVNEGLGAHLVSTLASIERDDVDPKNLGAAVRSALDDLRLVIDSLDPLDGDLLPALGMLRARLQPRLEEAGIRIEWRVGDLPPIEDLGPHRVLQVLRILQAAITEVLERPGASTITVRTGFAETSTRRPAVFVEIADDGQAPPSRVDSGEDFQRMRRRAVEIGAELESARTQQGSSLRLWLPTGDAVRP